MRQRGRDRETETETDTEKRSKLSRPLPPTPSLQPFFSQLAVAQHATQSSTLGPNVARLAVDGDTLQVRARTQREGGRHRGRDTWDAAQREWPGLLDDQHLLINTYQLIV